MANIIELPIFGDERGQLIVIEKILPFEVKRSYYIYNITSKRGGYRHHKTVQALICSGGCCEVYVNNGEKRNFYFR